MRRQDYPDTAELITRRMVVESQVHTALDQFLAAKRTEIGEAAFEHLTAVAAKNIIGAQSELRQVMVQTSKGNLTFESDAYWSMVDAIGFVADSIRGRWPYMGVTERDNALTNALATVANVERQLRGDFKAPAQPFEYTESDEVADSITADAPRD